MNFALILFVLLVISGAMWLLDVALLERARRRTANAALSDFDARNSNAPQVVAAERAALQERLTRRPWYMEYTASFFPVILLVFVLRSFLFEPFRIPSGSMLPTLEVGDLILVNKFEYGLRLPVINRKVVELGTPARGDVMVFRFPLNPSQDYIKRVVGLPGDRVEYIDKRLSINGVAVPIEPVTTERADNQDWTQYKRYQERLGQVEHQILVADGPSIPPMRFATHTHPNACRYSSEGISCTVPAGHYFVMGDNRDNSEDSRFWGFVPDQNIVGHAFFVWATLRGWVPSFDRVGRFH